MHDWFNSYSNFYTLDLFLSILHLQKSKVKSINYKKYSLRKSNEGSLVAEIEIWAQKWSEIAGRRKHFFFNLSQDQQLQPAGE